MTRQLFTPGDPEAGPSAAESGADAARDWARGRFPLLLEAWVCRRDREALDEMSRWFLERARRWAPAYVPRRSAAEDPEDVAADAVGRALAGLEGLWAKYGRRADGEAYLRMHLKAAAREQRRPAPGPAPSSGWPSPADVIMDRLQRHAVWECMERWLDLTTRQILRLRFVDGLDLREIADLLAITHENARKRYSEALRHRDFIECLVRSVYEG
jgi:RNA polymerase sigma factor (sigma-70 family)